MVFTALSDLVPARIGSTLRRGMPSSDPDQKISPELGSRVASDGNSVLDVVVELGPDTQDAPTAPKLRQSFELAAEPVTSTITNLGGEIVGKAWLNRTLRAKIPAQRLAELTGLDEVALLDVPHGLTPD